MTKTRAEIAQEYGLVPYDDRLHLQDYALVLYRAARIAYEHKKKDDYACHYIAWMQGLAQSCSHYERYRRGLGVLPLPPY